MKSTSVATIAAFATASEAQLNPLHHLGGNSPHFNGPNVFNISSDAPEGCTVDQVAFAARHGSRYPDPGAYSGWLDLSEKVSSCRLSSLRYTNILINEQRSTLKPSAPMPPSSIPQDMATGPRQPICPALPAVPGRIQRTLRHGR